MFVILVGIISILFFSDVALANTTASQSDFTSEQFRVDTSKMSVIQSTSSDKWPEWFAAFERILNAISELLLMLIPILAGVSLIIAGYFFIFSGGEGDKVTKGKNIITFNLIAIIVAFMSWGIIYLIGTFFTKL